MLFKERAKLLRSHLQRYLICGLGGWYIQAREINACNVPELVPEIASCRPCELDNEDELPLFFHGILSFGGDINRSDTPSNSPWPSSPLECISVEIRLIQLLHTEFYIFE